MAGQGLDRLVLGSLGPGDPGHVHQPAPQRLLPVALVPVLGVERGQHRGQCRREHRIGLDQLPDVLGERLGGQLRRVQIGQVVGRGPQLR